MEARIEELDGADTELLEECGTPECGEPPLFGDKCLVCTREAILQRRREKMIDGTDLNTNPISDPVCDYCHKKASEVDGSFSTKKNMHRSCCIKATKEVKAAGAAPVKREKEREREREENKGDDLVTKLLAGLHSSLDSARKHHEALKTIKELTGADFDLPEINF